MTSGHDEVAEQRPVGEPAPVRATPRVMSAEETAALHRVQRRILAIVFFAVAIHGVLGLVVVADIVEGQDRRGSAIMLVVMSAVLAIIVSIVMRVILAAKPHGSWVWILVSLIPSAIGLYLVL